MNAKQLKELTDIMNKGGIYKILDQAKENAYYGIYFIIYPEPQFNSAIELKLFQLGLEQLGFKITKVPDDKEWCISWD